MEEASYKGLMIVMIVLMQQQLQYGDSYGYSSYLQIARDRHSAVRGMAKREDFLLYL